MGANEELDDLLTSTIQEMIGDQIMIRTVDGEERVYNVVSSQINHSIAGKKNIGICLGKEVSPDEVVAGSVVYYYSSNQLISSATWERIKKVSEGPLLLMG
ncbi:hypothetical protein [Paenibacillus sp. FSL R7-0652]|uniref:hypothetical protein n=1 Tax=Paenibacillus sp. FSL R7-0652 TaxID=2921687 RepID=UPI00315A9981